MPTRPAARVSKLREQLRAVALEVAFYVPKGGPGKTPHAKNWALTSGAGIITNEPHSPIDIGMPSSTVLKLQPGEAFPPVPPGMNVVYDLGGYPERALVPVLQRADVVVVPVFNKLQSIQHTIHALPEITRLAKRVAILITKVQSPADEASLRMALHQADVIDADTAVFISKQSRAFDRVMEGGTCIHDMCASVPLFAHAFRDVAAQLEALYRFFLTLPKR
jgi:hypothetical protein